MASSEKADGEAVPHIRGIPGDGNDPTFPVHLAPADSPAGSDMGASTRRPPRATRNQQSATRCRHRSLEQDWRVAVVTAFSSRSLEALLA